MSDRQRQYMLAMQDALHKEQKGRRMMLDEASKAAQRDKANAHVNYRRALERKGSKSVAVSKKYRPDILKRQLTGEGNER